MEKADITVEHVSIDEVIFHVKARDLSITEHEATFKLERVVEVHDSRAVNDSEVVFQQSVSWSGGQFSVPISRTDYELYTYEGTQIDVRIRAHLHVNDALIFDTKIDETYDLPLEHKPKSGLNPNQLIDPVDIYSFVDNFSAIPGRSQAKIVALMMLMAFGGILLTGYAFTRGSFLLGIFAIVGVGLGCKALFGLIKGQLRGYLEPGGRIRSLPVSRGKTVRLDELVDARAAVPVDEIKVRIVAANIECGQYRRGSGTNVRTVSFRNPVRGARFYESTIRDIAPGDSLADHLRGELVSFDSIFTSLYPPNRVSATHGLDIRWEVQILHDDFVDHEFVGPNDIFDYRHFLTDETDNEETEDEVIW